jgi:serine/threonine protein kinase
VLISSEGEVFLTDFGLARRNMDLSGEVFGTLEYMAPEQAEGMATFQSDLYAERSPHPVRVPQQA